MAQNLILVAIVLFLCLMAEKLSGKVGMPALILFMGVGMLFGSDGILRIAFDDYGLAQNICLIALCFIMFYGGFNMKERSKTSGRQSHLSFYYWCCCDSRSDSGILLGGFEV